MSEANSPAYAQGRIDKTRRNVYLLMCPPVDVDMYRPPFPAYPVMYRRGWDSVPEVTPHSCKRCRG